MAKALQSGRRAALVASATAVLFIGLTLLVPPGRHEFGRTTVEINTIAFCVVAILLSGLALTARFSTRPVWSRLAVASSAASLVLTGLHFAVVGIVWRVMGG